MYIYDIYYTYGYKFFFTMGLIVYTFVYFGQ